jgi:hypothetical protein
MIVSLIVCIILLCILLVLTRKSKVESYCDSEPYRKLNMSVGESSYKCGCPCVSYGSLFDYQAQKRQHKYGVPLGCQKIF